MKRNPITLIRPYLRSKILIFIILSFFVLIFSILSFIFSLPFEILSYTILLTLFAAFTGLCIEFYIYCKRIQKIDVIMDSIPHSIDNLSDDAKGLEQGYENCIKKFYRSYTETAELYERKKNDTLDYFTLWTHQIKTPLSALKAHVQANSSENSELISVINRELLKIEQYADMALQFIRLDSIETDFVFSKVDLFQIVKSSVKKFAPLFIASKNTLHLNEFTASVLSDEKWLSFVIEQIISNAVKYTKNGKVLVYMDEDKEDVLVIEDTGIGILPEDIQRLGEKGFTGCNGRIHKKASGLGLYLCKNILTMLGHSLSFASVSGKGTKVFINLHKK